MPWDSIPPPSYVPARLRSETLSMGEFSTYSVSDTGQRVIITRLTMSFAGTYPDFVYVYFNGNEIAAPVCQGSSLPTLANLELWIPMEQPDAIEIQAGSSITVGYVLSGLYISPPH